MAINGRRVKLILKVLQLMVSQDQIWKGTLKLLTTKNIQAEVPINSFLGSFYSQ